MATVARAIRGRALHEAAVDGGMPFWNEMENGFLPDRVAAYEDDD